MTKARPRRRAPAIAVIVDEDLWRKNTAALRLIRRAARLALKHGSYPPLEGGSKAASRLREDGFGEGLVAAAPSPKSSSRLRSKKISTLPQGEGGITILLTGNARLHVLNRKFRGMDKTTNVLSFPGAEAGHLGDIALAYQRVAREARAQRKSFAAHAAHLAVHGVLHLLGHDHERRSEAKLMESFEIELLGRLGIADPYTLPPLTRRRKAP